MVCVITELLEIYYFIRLVPSVINSRIQHKPLNIKFN